MKKLNVVLLSFVLVFLHASFVSSQNRQGKEGEAPEHQYDNASYGGESVTLQNDFIQLNFYKRINGWGWGEVLTPSGKMMGVIEHLGEIMLRDQDIPMRFVTDSFEKKRTDAGETLEFEVKSVVVRDVLEGTSFDNWMVYPFTEPAVVGTVSITLTPNSSLVKLKYRLKSTGNYYARYIRGPWIKAGESSFGTEKDDAILPGVDWAIHKEWTSGTDFFKDPWALRVAPHPFKVAVPLMSVSHNGDVIALSWDANQRATRWFNFREHLQQPVFASPNFVDRKNNQLMGLMLPDATIEGHENEVVAEIPLELKIGQMIHFDADLWISKGNSVTAMTDWVRRNGLPEPSEPKWPYEETLDRIAKAYNTNFWHEGKGFGLKQRPENKIRPNVPGFLRRYVQENEGTQLVRELTEKIEWSQAQLNDRSGESGPSKDAIIKRGERILADQQKDGLRGETALEITISPAVNLLDIWEITGEQRFLDAAEKALDFCMNMQRPEAGDYWETPLHAANLLAAGHAAEAYYLAFEATGDQKYKDKAVYWMRTLFAFTHLWEPKEVEMLYNTKPVLSSSDWYFANWVRDHVQWEVLAVFASLDLREIRWSEVDPAFDWLKFQEGITNAAIRWMNGPDDHNWWPHNLPSTIERYRGGEYDYAFPDTHNSVTGNYGGMMIMPSRIAENIYSIMDQKKEE